MKNFCKKMLAALLVALFILPVIPASAYTIQDIVDAAVEIIISNEGVYNTVLANDNGALSIGKVGWHATRALDLLKMIIEKNPENAKKILGNTLYNEIITSTNWNYRILTSAEKSVIQTLLGTSESIAVQDALCYKDIEGYITHGRSMGFTDGKVLVYFADLENQMGYSGVARVAKAAIAAAGSADKVTLDIIYNAAMSDKTAQSTPTRRKKVYKYCAALSFDGSTPANTYKTGKYEIDVSSSLNVRSGPGSAYDKIGSLYDGDEITVTEVSGDWGKIKYNGTTGWVNLMYAVYMDSSSTVTSKKGDVNTNGKIEAADARLIIRYSAGLEKFTDAQKKAADVNTDSKITAADARKVLRAAANLEKL